MQFSKNKLKDNHFKIIVIFQFTGTCSMNDAAL